MGAGLTLPLVLGGVPRGIIKSYMSKGRLLKEIRCCLRLLVLSAALIGCIPLAGARTGSEAAAVPRNIPPSPAKVPPQSELVPVPLPDASIVTITIPAAESIPSTWRRLTPQIIKEVQSLHRDFVGRYGAIPTFELSIRLIDTATFTALTGAAHWVEAMVYNGQILLPLPIKGDLDRRNLLRSLRHEYTHAVIAALTASRCVAWLNEGLAQLKEGAVDAAILEALSRRLAAAPPVEFTKLRSSFRALPTKELAAAYAQSLVAAAELEQRHGAAALRRYFDALRAGEAPEAAFAGAFGVGLSEFEAAAKELLAARERWPSSILVR